uniref:NCAM n=1 Tax=Rhabditophanes sp. KR3021 TaxID=114890 RepID=A0AC35U8C1_9BILA
MNFYQKAIIFLLLPILATGWKIKIGYPESHVAKGNYFSYRCTVVELDEGPEDISISFFKDNQLAPITQTNAPKKSKTAEEYYSVLMLHNVKESDSGSYECVVTVDNAEQRSGKIELTVVDPPEFIHPQPIQTPEEGNDAKINCFVKNHEEYDIYWKFNGTIIQEGTPRNYELQEESQVLVIKNFDSTNDNGDYECFAAYHNTIETLKIQVVGYARPTMTIFEPRGDVTETHEGANFTIQCQAVGKPKPTYEWQLSKKGKTTPIENSDKFKIQGGLLNIDSIDFDDAANYTCIATNALGSVKETLNLKVIKKATIKAISDVTVFGGEQVELVCNYISEGSTTAKWVFDGTVIEDGHDSMESNEDAQAVTTEKYETSQKTTESTEEDNESDEDDNKMVNSMNRIITESNNQIKLVIKNATKHDVGNYNCEVENKAGVVTESVEVVIKYAPIALDIDDLENVVQEGNNLTISCSFDAAPVAEITWTLNNEKLYPDGVMIVESQSEGVSTLELSGDLGEKMYGDYRCHASNIVKKDVQSEIIVVDVMSTPEAPTVTCSDEAKATYTTCTVQGYEGIRPGKKPTSLKFYLSESSMSSEEESEWQNASIIRTFTFGNTIVLKELTPGSQWEARVGGENDIGVSPLSAVFTVQTADATVSEPVESIHHECDTTCKFDWEEPELNGGQNVKYRLTFIEESHNETETEKKEKIVVETSLTGITVDNLKPSIEYSVNVVAITSIGESEEYYTTFETPETLKVPFSFLLKFDLPTIICIFALACVVLFLIVDVCCFISHRCGILACICVNCLGKDIKKGSSKNVEANVPENNKLLVDGQPANV